MMFDLCPAWRAVHAIAIGQFDRHGTNEPPRVKEDRCGEDIFDGMSSIQANCICPGFGFQFSTNHDQIKARERRRNSRIDKAITILCCI